MMWRQLSTDKNATEAALQAMFDEWPAPETDRLAGLPATLRGLTRAPRPTADCFGYSIEADVLLQGDERDVLLELKYADKYEPIALAEVLHHVRFMTHYQRRDRSLHPAIVGRYNAWTRLALSHLGQAFKTSPSISYFEVDILTDGNGQSFVWFDAPLHAWRSIEGTKGPPDFLPEPARSQLQWRFVDETASWIGLPTAQPDRPEILQGWYVMIAPIDRRPDEYLVWAGEAPSLGSTKAASRKLPAQFYLVDPRSTGRATEEPNLLPP